MTIFVEAHLEPCVEALGPLEDVGAVPVHEGAEVLAVFGDVAQHVQIEVTATRTLVRLPAHLPRKESTSCDSMPQARDETTHSVNNTVTQDIQFAA